MEGPKVLSGGQTRSCSALSPSCCLCMHTNQIRASITARTSRNGPFGVTLPLAQGHQQGHDSRAPPRQPRLVIRLEVKETVENAAQRAVSAEKVTLPYVGATSVQVAIHPGGIRRYSTSYRTRGRNGGGSGVLLFSRLSSGRRFFNCCSSPERTACVLPIVS